MLLSHERRIDVLDKENHALQTLLAETGGDRFLEVIHQLEKEFPQNVMGMVNNSKHESCCLTKK
jgi:hypothetical protein